MASQVSTLPAQCAAQVHGHFAQCYQMLRTEGSISCRIDGPRKKGMCVEADASNGEAAGMLTQLPFLSIENRRGDVCIAASVFESNFMILILAHHACAPQVQST